MAGPLGSGGVVSSGGSASGTISTVSKEEEMVLSSEVSSSSSFPEDSSIELGLGLSLGCGGVAMWKPAGQYARIFTAEDFPCVVSNAFSSSSTSATKPNYSSCGFKRNADSFSPPPPRSVVSQVVGWPPVRTSRMNSLVNQAKSPAFDDCNSIDAKSKTESIVPDRIDGSKKDNSEKGPKSSLFVKVNMDGMPIGRKVDLNAQACYAMLARTLDDMFCIPGMTINTRSSYSEDKGAITDPIGSLRLLDESSEYALTYEDKEGDWMLVGDVPWGMFVNSVKRLRIMRRSEANGLSPRSQERNERGRLKHI